MVGSKKYYIEKKSDPLDLVRDDIKNLWEHRRIRTKTNNMGNKPSSWNNSIILKKFTQ